MQLLNATDAAAEELLAPFPVLPIELDKPKPPPPPLPLDVDADVQMVAAVVIVTAKRIGFSQERARVDSNAEACGV